MPTLQWLTREQDLKAAANAEYRLLVEEEKYSYGDLDGGGGGNIIVQGDNLEALKSLLPFYAGQVKCIYIDPPYNTGSAFEHYDDNLEHTIWLSMMYPRLKLLKSFLREDGSIWISIDDMEVSYLKIICDEIFGRNNFVAQLPTVMNLKGNQDEFAFAGTHEYTLVYAKHKALLKLNQFSIDEEELADKWEVDEIGQYKQGANLKATGINAPREKRPNLFFPIYISNKDELSLSPIPDYIKLLPVTDGQEMSWRWSKQKILSSMKDIIVKRSKDGVSLYKKQRPELGELPSKKPKTLFYKPEYSSGNGTNQINVLFGAKVFNYPKPEELIADFLTLATNPGDYVLDSFLGSGTTAAVAHKMGRKYIGVEMGEQAKTHCAARLKKVIEGEQGGISEAAGWKGGGGFRFFKLGEAIFDSERRIKPDISFANLAAHIYFTETKTPMKKRKKDSAFLGVYEGTAYALLYNGILGDKSVSGGNVLTHKTLNHIMNEIEAAEKKRNCAFIYDKIVIYGEAARLTHVSLKFNNIIFKQTPYDIKVW